MCIDLKALGEIILLMYQILFLFLSIAGMLWAVYFIITGGKATWKEVNKP